MSKADTLADAIRKAPIAATPALAFCLLAALGILPGRAAWANFDPKFKPMEQFVVKPAKPDAPAGQLMPLPAHFLPIDLDQRASDQAFVQNRCAGLVMAVQAITPMEVSNPLTGVDHSRAKPLEWAAGVDDKASFPLAGKDEQRGYAADYFSIFGPPTATQTFTDLPVYVQDKARCLPLLKYLKN
ncbi:hypothetical protein [Paracoccus pacificus]|uniref:Uncharacterized protein n=1 Tax=Paracoccus pacificus TaxID=1463598 RepID=A0ABW4R9E5_9RHOB